MVNTITCPNCGANTQNRHICEYCGYKIIVDSTDIEDTYLAIRNDIYSKIDAVIDDYIKKIEEFCAKPQGGELSLCFNFKGETQCLNQFSKNDATSKLHRMDDANKIVCRCYGDPRDKNDYGFYFIEYLSRKDIERLKEFEINTLIDSYEECTPGSRCSECCYPEDGTCILEWDDKIYSRVDMQIAVWDHGHINENLKQVLMRYCAVSFASSLAKSKVNDFNVECLDYDILSRGEVYSRENKASSLMTEIGDGVGAFTITIVVCAVIFLIFALILS